MLTIKMHVEFPLFILKCQSSLCSCEFYFYYSNISEKVAVKQENNKRDIRKMYFFYLLPLFNLFSKCKNVLRDSHMKKLIKNIAGTVVFNSLCTFNKTIFLFYLTVILGIFSYPVALTPWMLVVYKLFWF
jgi:hypothetical protein